MDEEVEAHLTSCRECREAVRESKLWLAMWGSDPEAFAEGSRTREAGRRFLGDMVGRRGSPVSLRRRWALGGASLIAAAVLAFMVWRPGNERLPFSIAPVATAIDETALRGRILIPGAEDAQLVERGPYRSGFAPLSAEVDTTLHRMAEAYISGSTDEELAVALVGGYLAAGQTGSARDFVRDARARFPNDERFIVLEALVDYCEGRLPEAEKRLREALERDPDDPLTMVNLAHVLAETGRVSDAMTLARSVQRGSRNVVLRARADSILAGASAHP